MTTIYPINPSSGGGSPPPVFNGSNNGLVPNPGAGAASRVLNATGVWVAPAAAQTISLNPSFTSAILGGITWTTTWADPITLSTSITMSVARMNSNIYNNALGATAIDAVYNTSGAQLITRNRWGSNIATITFGLYSASWNCDFYGTILCNGSWFQVMGGASLNQNNSDMLITKLT